jgi:hypothetical protein
VQNLLEIAADDLRKQLKLHHHWFLLIRDFMTTRNILPLHQLERVGKELERLIVAKMLVQAKCGLAGTGIACFLSNCFADLKSCI